MVLYYFLMNLIIWSNKISFVPPFFFHFLADMKTSTLKNAKPGFPMPRLLKKVTSGGLLHVGEVDEAGNAIVSIIYWSSRSA